MLISWIDVLLWLKQNVSSKYFWPKLTMSYFLFWHLIKPCTIWTHISTFQIAVLLVIDHLKTLVGWFAVVTVLGKLIIACKLQTIHNLKVVKVKQSKDSCIATFNHSFWYQCDEKILEFICGSWHLSVCLIVYTQLSVQGISINMIMLFN